MNYPTSSIERDCEYLDLDCGLDFESPETIIVEEQGAIFSKDLEIEYSVLDDFYNINDITTYYCMAPQGNTCYPINIPDNAATYNKITKIMDTEGVVNYNLYYYSPSRLCVLVASPPRRVGPKDIFEMASSVSNTRLKKSNKTPNMS